MLEKGESLVGFHCQHVLKITGAKTNATISCTLAKNSGIDCDMLPFFQNFGKSF